MSQFIEILEVGPRDGFQNQSTYIEKETKLQIKLKRILEKPVLWRYRKKHPLKDR